MIEIVKRIRITGGNAPFTYQWSSSKSCLTFDKPAGETNEEIVTTLSFESEACAPEITLTVISSCGNKQVFNINNTLPCSEMIVSNISESKRIFSVVVSNNQCTDHTFKWEYDTTVWNNATPQDYSYGSSIILVKNDSVITKKNTDVKVTITDQCYGCSVTKNYTYTFNVFAPKDIVSNLAEYLDVDKYKYTGSIDFEVPVGMNASSASVTLVNVPSTITYTNTGLSYVFTTTSKETQTFKYYVSDGDGNKSILGNVILIPQVNTAEYSIVLTPIVLEVCTDSNTYRIPVTNNVNSSGTINWDTFTILQDPLYSSPSITFDKATKEIVYVKPTGFNSDVFKFTVADITNKYAKSTSVTLTKCIIAPTANNDTLTMQSGTTSTLNVLNNDLDNGTTLDITSVEVSQVPTGLSVNVNRDTGVLSVTASSGAAGTYTFKYTVKNVSGKVSNEATVTVDVVYAGSDVSIVVCN